MKNLTMIFGFNLSPIFDRVRLLLVIIIFYQFNAASQSSNDPVEILQIISDNISDKILEDNQVDSLMKVVSFLKKYHNENKNSGQITFGLDANSSKMASLSRVQTGIKYKFGYFPYNIDVIAQLQTDYRKGELEESISNVDISYDFNLKKRNDGKTSQRDLVYESFVYLNRSSNSYIGLESKYEIGGGFIFNFWSGFGEHGTTVNGTINKTKLTNLPYSRNSGDKKTKPIIGSYEAIKTRYPKLKDLKEDQKESLFNVYEDVWLSNIKSYSRLRLAMLVSVFNEIEKVTIFDSVRQSDNTFFYPSAESHPATSKWRIALRPTVYLNLSDEIRIKLLPYIKFTPIELHNTVSIQHEGNTFTSKKQDYVWNVIGEVSFKVAPNFSTSVQYTEMYINAPTRKFILDDFDIPVLFMAQKHHRQVKINFTYEFK